MVLTLTIIPNVQAGNDTPEPTPQKAQAVSRPGRFNGYDKIKYNFIFVSFTRWRIVCDMNYPNEVCVENINVNIGDGDKSEPLPNGPKLFNAVIVVNNGPLIQGTLVGWDETNPAQLIYDIEVE